MITSFRIYLASAILLAVFSTNAYTQEARLPAFDSFSYLRDPLFSYVAVHKMAVLSEPVECVAPQAEVKTEPAPYIVKLECPEVPETQALSQKERFELQLALDKALSQILKLSVDYEALRTRVQNLNLPASGRQSSSPQGRGELQELMALNAKRLADRDQRLSVLQTRLDKAQGRYDSENVSRLRAEKKLKTLQAKNGKVKQSIASSDEKIDLLAHQLKENQSLIQQLKFELATEKSSKAKWLTEQKRPMADSKQAGTIEQSVSSFKLSQEWVIDGLKFKQGSADIQLNSIQQLDRLVDYLKQNSVLNIQVNGYTDSVGSAESNLRLSQARAESVVEYLVDQGIEFYRVKALGYGERRPLGNNELEQGRLLNRRVAVLFLN